MAAGFRAAGITFDLAFDVDKDACDSYEANLGRRPVQMDAHDLLRMAIAGWRPDGGMRLLVADPPCMPWSRAGKRLGTADERDILEVTAELISLLRPAVYLISNVPGLNDACNRCTVQRVIGGLSKHGYCTADHTQLDAADFGVPQHRVRPFWFGHRLDTPCIRWPRPTHGDPTEVSRQHLPWIEPLRPWVTCREALAHLPAGELGRPVRLRAKYGNVDDHERHPTSEIDAPARTLRSDGGLAGRREAVLTANQRHPPTSPTSPTSPDSPAPTITAKDRQQSTVLAPWPWDRPATTVVADPRLAPPGHHGPSEQRGPNAIILSERAAAILQGFPDPGAPGGWRFCGRTKRTRWSQIGQAMPPPLAQAVATSMRAQQNE